ncbi:MAG: single-stranded DNA-binding protein [candidate division WOR-3 bacterium]|nr:MAG: single-stranded DNA-binding protein [candidate division WOR-3 bacterium]
MNPLRLGYLNNVQLIGRLVADPELRYTQKGAPVCDFRIASSRRYKNRETGEPQEETLFINVVAWRRQAELANDFLKKGSAVLIEGRLRSRQWETNTGEKRSAIEVIARRIQFLDMPTEKEVSEEGPAADTETEYKDEGEVETPF